MAMIRPRCVQGALFSVPKPLAQASRGAAALPILRFGSQPVHFPNSITIRGRELVHYYRITGRRIDGRRIRGNKSQGRIKGSWAGIKESQRFFTFLPADDTRAELVSGVAERLLKVVKSTRGAVPWNWHISIVDDDSTQSIVHLGGGKILVFTGILEWVQHDENHLAALLAHEIAHASARHFAKAKWRRHTFSSTPRYCFYLSPRESQTDMIDEGTTDFGFELPYWKEQEEEVDLISLRILRLAGYETDTYCAVLERFLEEKSRIRYSQDDFADRLLGPTSRRREKSCKP